jgi:hypothetical protein
VEGFDENSVGMSSERQVRILGINVEIILFQVNIWLFG